MLLLPITLIHHLANSYWEYSNLSSRSCYLIFGVQVLTFRLGVGGHSFQFKCFRNPCCWCGWRWFYGSCCCYVWWVSWTVKVTFNTASHSFGNYGWEKYIAIKSVLSHVSFPRWVFVKREDYDALVHVGRTHLIGKCDILEPPSLH